ncbi:uncharacterized domain 1-containing protein [Bradyrhizobium sp. Rc2d]|nr:uncharacterized domain 1-containing protein [Bradyrhizobium sp. Rc2d]
MTQADQLDLFSPDQRRERVVDWQAPAPVAKVVRGLSGMDAMLGIRDGRLPPPPFAKLIGFTMAVVEPGRIVMELEPHEDLENTIGLLHGATAAGLLDTAMGCAISTRLEVGQGSVTLDLKLTFLRPLGPDLGRRQGDQAGAPDELYRRLRSRREGRAGGACNCNLFYDRQQSNCELMRRSRHLRVMR